VDATGRDAGARPRDFQVDVDERGDTLIYPKGDRTARPSGRLPKGGYYFDSIVRQDPIDEDRLDPRDWAEQFELYSDEDLRYFEDASTRLYHETDCALVGNFWQAASATSPTCPGPGSPTPRASATRTSGTSTSSPTPTTSRGSSTSRPTSRSRTSSSTARSWATGSRCW